MIRFQSIIPVSLFKKDTKEYLTKLEVCQGPILLTVHGRGALVIEDLNSYMQIAALAESARHEQALSALVDRIQNNASEQI